MPILKANEPLPKRPVVILIYGEPGIGKTSLFNTSTNPLLIDFDRGKDRAIFRQDTLVVNTWEDIEAEEKAGTLKSYATVGIDTAKAALDDFLMSYVTKKDFKNAKNKLAAYGAIGDEFKIFVSNRRAETSDIIIIAHSKDEKDGETIKKVPDVTGGSYQLLLRIADQVGYMSMKNNHRTIQFEPTDNTVGKNVARLPLINIPNEEEPEFRVFMNTIIDKVKTSVIEKSEAQAEAIAKSEAYQDEIAAIDNVDDLNMIINPVQALPKYLKDPLNKLIGEKAKKFGWTFDKATREFVDPNPPAEEEELQEDPATEDTEQEDPEEFTAAAEPEAPAPPPANAPKKATTTTAKKPKAAAPKKQLETEELPFK